MMPACAIYKEVSGIYDSERLTNAEHTLFAKGLQQESVNLSHKELAAIYIV